jgi:hypothetical protein
LEAWERKRWHQPVATENGEEEEARRKKIDQEGESKKEEKIQIHEPRGQRVRPVVLASQ